MTRELMRAEMRTTEKSAGFLIVALGTSVTEEFDDAFETDSVGNVVGELEGYVLEIIAMELR